MSNEILIALAFLVGTLTPGALSITFTFKNNCNYTVWPANHGDTPTNTLRRTGFELQPETSMDLQAPAGYAGRLWARNKCLFSERTHGWFSCATANCGSGKVECDNRSGFGPMSFAHFTLNGTGGVDSYQLSVAEGFNVPLSVKPANSACRATGCPTDINAMCPSELLVLGLDNGQAACFSPCQKFDTDEYCCRGDFKDPGKCQRSNYTQIFKNACPLAASYPYDQTSTTFTCPSGGDYVITFCPTETD